MTTEDLLDGIIEKLNKDTTSLTEFYATLVDDHPVVVSYLTGLDTTLLTDDEHDYLLYLGMVLISVYSAQGHLSGDPDPEVLEGHEEDLWQQINDLSPQPLDKIRERTPKDAVVLNFILEALEDDEELDFLTEPGAQMIYVKLASLDAAMGS